MIVRRNQTGFTLIEILMVVVIIGVLSTVALRSVQNSMESARVNETQDEMQALAHAIAGNPELYANGFRSDFGYVGDVGALPVALDNLVTNPGGYSTWNGPYIGRRFTEDSDGYKKDAWGNTYTFSGGITIASTGGGVTPLTKNVASAATDLTTTPVAGTLTDAAGNPPGDSSVAVSITITYPDGSGGTTTATANPNGGGSFSLSTIPVGNHQVYAVYRATDDTVFAVASTLPRSGATVGLRLPGAVFAPTGGGVGGIEYVAGTAATSGASDEDLNFSITNTSSAGIVVQWMVLTYSPSVHYRRIRWNGTSVFNETNPRASSGDTAPFTSPQSINAGAIIPIKVQDFQDAPTGGSNTSVEGVTFTIEFSSGESISFTTP